VASFINYEDFIRITTTWDKNTPVDQGSTVQIFDKEKCDHILCYVML